jgi:hypothetical protein
MKKLTPLLALALALAGCGTVGTDVHESAVFETDRFETVWRSPLHSAAAVASRRQTVERGLDRVCLGGYEIEDVHVSPALYNTMSYTFTGTCLLAPAP